MRTLAAVACTLLGAGMLVGHLYAIVVYRYHVSDLAAFGNGAVLAAAYALWRRAWRRA